MRVAGERTTSHSTFAAIVFFGTATTGLLVLLLLERRASVPRASGLTPEEQVNVHVFEEVSPSVVHLVSTGRTLIPSTHGEEQPPSSGSGIVWDERGLIVTNDHLIRDRLAGEVVLADGSRSRVEYVGSDQEADLAVLFVLERSEPWKPARRGSSEGLRVGQRVFAIGNPFGLDQSLTVGVVSGLGRRVEGYYPGSTHEGVIQTDAAVNPGNSGGPLVDSRGRVVGINTAIAPESVTSAGVGFAIPVETIERVVAQILEQGFEPWPEIGLVLAPDGFESQWGWTAERGPFGLVPIQVMAGSPAAEAGIVPIQLVEGGLAQVLFDRIRSVDGVEIERRAQASEIFASKRAGDEVRLEVLRGMPGELHEFTLVWGER